MYQCLLNKCGFLHCQSWTFDIQNPRSVGLKKKCCVLLCANHPIGIEKEKKKSKKRVAASREETGVPASLRMGERFFYLQLYPEQMWHSKHLPAMDNTTGF